MPSVSKDPNIDKYYVYRLLELTTFTDEEIKLSYRRLFTERQNSSLSLGLEDLIVEKQQKNDNNRTVARKKASQIATQFLQVSPATDNISFEEFKEKIKASAEDLDPRVWQLAGSFLLVGTSVGIVIPCMPLLVQSIGMTTSEFGVVISAFGLSKMLGNIPSAYWVDRYGRKAVMIYGLGLCAIGMGSVGLTLEMGSLATYWLIGSRLITGLGVSLFTGGSFMLINDVSTALNRARTMAPMMSGFQAGTALGPAIGGGLIGVMGVSATYYLVGAVFGAMTVLNKIYLKETKPVLITTADSTAKNANNNNNSSGAFSEVLGAFSTAGKAWKELMKSQPLNQILFVNFIFWYCLAGTQMTLLPLLMVSPHFNLGATEIGATFAFMSLVSVFSSQPLAYLADRVGKELTIVMGAGLVGSSMIALPCASSFPTLLACAMPLALGSTVFGTAPVAKISGAYLNTTPIVHNPYVPNLRALPHSCLPDLTEPSDRAQALALLRTAGDLGLLLGATSSGILADVITMENTIMANGSLVCLMALWFASRNSTILFAAMSPKEKSNNKKSPS